MDGYRSGQPFDQAQLKRRHATSAGFSWEWSEKQQHNQLNQLNPALRQRLESILDKVADVLKQGTPIYPKMDAYHPNEQHIAGMLVTTDHHRRSASYRLEISFGDVGKTSRGPRVVLSILGVKRDAMDALFQRARGNLNALAGEMAKQCDLSVPTEMNGAAPGNGHGAVALAASGPSVAFEQNARAEALPAPATVDTSTPLTETQRHVVRIVALAHGMFNGRSIDPGALARALVASRDPVPDARQLIEAMYRKGHFVLDEADADSLRLTEAGYAYCFYGPHAASQ